MKLTISDIEKNISLRELEERLKPQFDGHPESCYDSSDSRFMGKNESLIKIIFDDLQTMEKLNLDYEKIAKLIEDLNYKDIEMINDKYKILKVYTCGEQECRWDDGETDKAFYMLVYDMYNSDHIDFIQNWKKAGGILPQDYATFNRQFKDEPVLVISGMMPHLISEHYFFHGKESVYRCDPEQLMKYLGDLYD